MTRSATPPARSAGDRPHVSLVVVNARVFTGSPRRPWADALAVSGERLTAVGSSAEIRKVAGDSARVVDARGSLVVPGADGDARRAAALVLAGSTTAGEALVVGAAASFTLLDRDLTGLHPAEALGAHAVLIVALGQVVTDCPV